MIGSGVVGGLVVALILSLVSWAREKSQQKHEARLRLRDERIRAYSEVLKATSLVDPKNSRTIDLGMVDMFHAVSVARMVAGGDQEISDALDRLQDAWNSFREEAQKGLLCIDNQEVENRKKALNDCRQDFLKATQKQTGTKE